MFPIGSKGVRVNVSSCGSAAFVKRFFKAPWAACDLSLRMEVCWHLSCPDWSLYVSNKLPVVECMLSSTPSSNIFTTLYVGFCSSSAAASLALAAILVPVSMLLPVGASNPA
eukprot:5254273-Karenia_brevis.AAC.1